MTESPKAMGGETRHRIMYVCTACADNYPEGCGQYDRNDLHVLPDGQWLCESCLDDTDQKDRGNFDVDQYILWSDLPAPEELSLSPPSVKAGAADGELARLADRLDRARNRLTPEKEIRAVATELRRLASRPPQIGGEEPVPVEPLENLLARKIWGAQFDLLPNSIKLGCGELAHEIISTYDLPPISAHIGHTDGEPVAWVPYHPDTGYNIAAARKKKHSVERYIQQAAVNAVVCPLFARLMSNIDGQKDARIAELEAEIERLREDREWVARKNDELAKDVSRLKTQRDNALLDMDRALKTADLFESNARVQAKLLEEAGRERDGLRKSLELTQGAIHLLRKAIHAADPREELDFRCHEIWTDIERSLFPANAGGAE